MQKKDPDFLFLKDGDVSRLLGSACPLEKSKMVFTVQTLDRAAVSFKDGVPYFQI